MKRQLIVLSGLVVSFISVLKLSKFTFAWGEVSGTSIGPVTGDVTLTFEMGPHGYVLVASPGLVTVIASGGAAVLFSERSQTGLVNTGAVSLIEVVKISSSDRWAIEFHNATLISSSAGTGGSTPLGHDRSKGNDVLEIASATSAF